MDRHETIPALVRDARPEDAAAVAHMANELAKLTAGRRGMMTPARVLADLIEGEGLGLVVALRGGAALGYALYTVAYETVFAARGLYLTDLYVIPEARRQGLARAILAELARRAEADGGRYIWWVTTPGNETANAVYDALGAIRDPVLARAVFDAPFERLKARS